MSRWASGFGTRESVPRGDVGLGCENGDPGPAGAAQERGTPDEGCPAPGGGENQQADDGFEGLGAVVEWLRLSNEPGTEPQERIAAEDGEGVTGNEDSNLVDALLERLDSIECDQIPR
jgi:hypothetical protein